MKSPVAALALLLSAWPLAAAPPPPADVAAVASWLDSLGPRREGSAAEASVLHAVSQWFSSRTTVHDAGFANLDEEHSFSRRVWFRIEGPRPGELVVVAPTDGSNSRGVAWAAAWADDALTLGTPISITFLFTGAERGSEESEGLGSRTFLEDFTPSTPAAVLYLDANTGERVELTAFSGAYSSPLWMAGGLSKSLDAQTVEHRFSGTSPALVRLDVPERRNALEPWFDREVPGLLVAAGPARGAVVRGLEGFVAGLEGGVPSTWDRHYLVFDFGPLKAFWSQQTYLAVFLAVAAALLFGYALGGRRLRGTVRVLGPSLWQLPVLFGWLFGSLFVATLAVDFIGGWAGRAGWQDAPPIFAAFKTVLAGGLAFLPFLRYPGNPLTRRADFYGQGALIALGVMVVVSAAVELSLSFYFLWALAAAALFLAVPWRPAKLLLLLLGPIWLVKAAFDVLSLQPDATLTRWALASAVPGNLALAVLLFPFLLQTRAWRLSLNRPPGTRVTWLRLGLWLGGTAALAVAAWAVQMPPQPTSVERIDIRTHTRTVGVPAVPLPFAADDWKSRVVRADFLNRDVWTVTFSGPRDPESVDLELVGSEKLNLLDSSFPSILEPDGYHARVIVGRQPRLPLTVKLTLPGGSKARLDVKARFAAPRALEVTDSVRLEP